MNGANHVFENLPQAFQGARKKSILQNIILFCRILRKLKINVTMSRVLDVFRSLQHITISHKDELYYALRGNLISSHEEIPVFNQIFQVFWVFSEEMLDSGETNGFQQTLEDLIARECFVDEWCEELPDGNESERLDQEESPTYSPLETLSAKDFSGFTDEDVERIKDVIALIANRIATRKTRRKCIDTKGYELSLRNTLRKSMKCGGEILELTRTKKKIKKLKLITLADVSGSMDCYSNFFIQFVYSLQTRIKGVESFVFSTRLTRITNLLKNRAIDEALNEISKIVLHWSGGTNIGLCLEKFNNSYAPGIVDKRSVVMIISDGWDRGDTKLLEREVKKLKDKCYKIIWLNPLLSNRNYQPLCKGITAVLPHLSYFLPFYNLNSLIALERTLRSIQ